MAYYTPEQVETILKLKGSTLRKYVLLLESEGITYQKNEQGHRFYSDTDIATLQKFITYKNSGAMNLKESAQAVYLWSISDDLAAIATPQVAVTSDIERYDVSIQESLLTTLSEQQKLIKDMTLMLEAQAEQNALIMAELNATRNDMRQLTEQLPDKQLLNAPGQPVQKDSRGLWARIWNK